MATESGNKKDVLKLSLDELRIIYARLDVAQATARLRTLTFLGAALALLSYLYGNGDLFIPAERYGKVFYFLGLGLIISAISLLMHAMRPKQWSVPIESKMTKLKRNKTQLELLEQLVEDYTECMLHNVAIYEKQMPYLYSSFFQILCGGTLLLVLKNIGG